MEVEGMMSWWNQYFLNLLEGADGGRSNNFSNFEENTDIEFDEIDNADGSRKNGIAPRVEK